MAVAAGDKHTIVLNEDGICFSFGDNEYGQLGTGDTTRRLIPTRVAGLPPSVGPVRQVAAGAIHTGIVTDAGDLFMCGYGSDGQLGLGDSNHRATPTLVGREVFNGEAVLMVSCGMHHTTVVTESGNVYTFGKGEYGQLGHGDEKTKLVPHQVPSAGFNGERIVMAAAGMYHTVALSEAGNVFTWGYGMTGCLGHNTWNDRRAPRQVDGMWFGGGKVVFVAAGGFHTAAVTAEGSLFTWGHGEYGQLGHHSNITMYVPNLVVAGVFRGSVVVMAACGRNHTLAVTQDGGLWACGRGCKGQLGLNDTKNKYVFRQVGVAAFGGAKVVTAAAGYKPPLNPGHSVAVTEDGALWTWGDSRSGQLGHGDVETRLVPTRVAAASLHGTRIGRCRPLPTTHALAFSMGTHGRLGAASPLAALAGEPGLLTMIASAANRWIGGAAGESEALVRLLGGVSADRRRRYVQTTQAGS